MQKDAIFLSHRVGPHRVREGTDPGSDGKKWEKKEGKRKNRRREEGRKDEGRVGEKEEQKR